MTNENNRSTLSNSTIPSSSGGYPVELRVTFGIIASVAFLANGLLCIVIAKRRTMLKKSHNTLVFTLAVIDTLTGVFIGISPLYVLGQGILTVPEGIAGELFCRLIDNSFFVWAFVKFSVAIVTCMAIERWFAIARPLQHNIHFTRTRTLVYVGLTLLAVCILSSILFFEKQLAFKDSTPVCVWRALISGTAANQVFTVLYCTVTAFLPLFITMATFGYLYTVLSRPAPPISNVQARTNRKRAEVRLCFMSALVAICLAVCFVPNQVSYILSKFGITKLGSPGHHFTVVLSLFNSCINPFVYCLSNRSYRREFLLLICPCKANEVVPIVTDNSNSGRVGPQTLRSTNEGVIPGPTFSTQC